MKKVYLGDSVYAKLTQFGEIQLTTENGSFTTNTIILEPNVIYNFDLWREQLKNALNEESNAIND